MHELEFHESAEIDPEHLSTLYRRLGDRVADHLICDAMEDLALALARLGRARSAGAPATMLAHVEDLQQIARRIGLPTLARVAADVRGCAGEAAAAPDDAPASVAFAATLARLERVAEGSLAAIWNPHDVTL